MWRIKRSVFLYYRYIQVPICTWETPWSKGRSFLGPTRPNWSFLALRPHHPHREAWRWQQHAVGMLLCFYFMSHIITILIEISLNFYNFFKCYFFLIWKSHIFVDHDRFFESAKKGVNALIQALYINKFDFTSLISFFHLWVSDKYDKTYFLNVEPVSIESFVANKGLFLLQIPAVWCITEDLTGDFPASRNYLRESWNQGWQSFRTMVD